MSAPSVELFLKAPGLVHEGVCHGFSTRRGGVSVGEYASLNLARESRDAAASVAENHRRLAAAAGFAADSLGSPVQVHGAGVVRVHAPHDAARECDALVTDVSGLPIGIRTADCVPVLLWHPKTGRAAAIHAGWRGVAAGIVAAGLAAMGAPAREMLAAIGPAIGGCCYEVDDGTAARVLAAAPSTRTVPTRTGHSRIDLVSGVRGQLSAAGIPEARIDSVGGCTACDSTMFFSHRRDHGRTGRHLSFVVGGGPR